MYLNISLKTLNTQDFNFFVDNSLQEHFRDMFAPNLSVLEI